ARSSTPSSLFEAPVVASDTLEWSQLPELKVDPSDSMAAWLAGVSVPDPTARLAVLDGATEQTVEVQLARARAAIDAGQSEVAEAALNAVLVEDPWEWRAVWLNGLACLARSDSAAAQAAFNGVYGQVPGELAPKLALALACERGGQPDVAEQLYSVCARTDASFTPPAAFGLARIRAARGDVAGALDALDLVAPTSRAYVDARRRRASLLATSRQSLDALAAAIDSIANVSIDPRDRQALVVEVLESALAEVRRSGPHPSTTIAGIPAGERDLREGVERAYRQLAALTEDHRERVRLVDAANRARPRTLV
ncbi:MAG TPA: tetratricopeptide repeat protein, partial [Acidimicrobiales bacterium]|nr:tetratricopeptide repeat protein [Acidimicrobiales bacterium]